MLQRWGGGVEPAGEQEAGEKRALGKISHRARRVRERRRGNGGIWRF